MTRATVVLLVFSTGCIQSLPIPDAALSTRPLHVKVTRNPVTFNRTIRFEFEDAPMRYTSGCPTLDEATWRGEKIAATQTGRTPLWVEKHASCDIVCGPPVPERVDTCPGPHFEVEETPNLEPGVLEIKTPTAHFVVTVPGDPAAEAAHAGLASPSIQAGTRVASGAPVNINLEGSGVGTWEVASRNLTYDAEIMMQPCGGGRAWGNMEVPSGPLCVQLVLPTRVEAQVKLTFWTAVATTTTTGAVECQGLSTCTLEVDDTPGPAMAFESPVFILTGPQ